VSKRWRKWLLRGVVVLLYLVTWVGGWHTHARELEDSAQARYRLVQERNAERQAHEPDARVPLWDRLREGGPATGVEWAVPLLPGVLLADSSEVLGPLNGRGTVKLLLYYGHGTAVVCELWGWIS
jgi:hypothetical protein